jgi:uncharacterized membrane protein YsdA (DUF1294 family)
MSDLSAFTDPRDRPVLLSALGGAFILYLVATRSLGMMPVLAWLLAWTPSAFLAYGWDKRQARRGGWRVPELYLHALALVGGVIGAWAGRAVFRHKTRKPVFLVVLIAASVLWAAVASWAILVR